MEAGNKRIDDRGMTLVELLIAIVILAIITVPLLHSFVSSARVNMDARKRLRLTTVAQDVMEGVKAYSLAELAEQFNYPDDVSPGHGFHVINRSLVNGGIGGLSENRCSIDANGGVTGLVNVDPGMPSTDLYPSTEPVAGSLSYNFVPRDGSYASARNDGLFYFTMQNVSVDDPATALDKVDVIIKADANPYRDPSENPYGAGAAEAVSGNRAWHNTSSFIDIDDMNDRSDFLFNIKLQKLIDDNLPGIGLTTKDVYCKIDVEHNPGHIVKTRVEVRRVTDPITAAPLLSETTQITKSESRNIFLMYYPTYGAKFHSNPSSPADVINFTNNTTEAVSLYIVKQYDSSDAYIRANLHDCENDYKCKVNITDAGMNTRIRTNLDYNLEEIINNEGSLVRMDAVGGAGIRQSTYNYNGGPMSAADEAVYFTSMGGGASSDRLYDVTVYVYKQGSISGAGVGGSIPADNLLVSLDGTIR